MSHEQAGNGTEWERQWAVVTENSDDFSAWESLIRLAESGQSVADTTQTPAGPVSADSPPVLASNLRSVYDHFLAKFPLCFGYWKKYADAEMRIGGVDKATEVFERAVVAIHNSIDLWNHYCQFKLDKSGGDAESIRAVFERASQGVGHDFLSHTFWDKYIDYEENKQQDTAKVFAILERIIRIPLHQYSRYFEKYSQISVARPVEELIESEEFDRLTADIRTAHPNKTTSEIEQELRQKIHTIKSDIYLKTQESVHKRWAFESEIKRPYFHIKPLDDAQLGVWRKYLDFEEAEGDATRVYVLYERCLVACALYEEFWLRYARFLIARGDVERAQNVYYRAANLFLAPGRTECRLEFAAFEEEQGRVPEAAQIYSKVLENVPGHVESLFKYANFMRRHYGVEKGEDCYTSAIGLATDDKSKGFLVAAKAKYIYNLKGSIDEARAVFLEGVPSLESRYLLLQYFLFEINLPGENLDHAAAAWDAVKASSVFTEYDKLTLGNRYADFLLERDANVAAYRALTLFLQTSYSMPTSEAALGDGASRKRGAETENGDDKAYKMAKTSANVTPVVTAAAVGMGGYGQTGVAAAAAYGGYGQQAAVGGAAAWGGYGGGGGFGGY
ncbi:hypothetical protein BJ741DRAFT_591751 [Chytriomyces cf. hyalinus JEL632]|nr:hypothetical protein BJ741DRAFT_591751 [Chytriomyces cf. hyalinus JEL632]